MQHTTAWPVRIILHHFVPLRFICYGFFFHPSTCLLASYRLSLSIAMYGHCVPHLITSYHFVIRLTISHHVLSRIATSCHIFPRRSTSCHIQPDLTTIAPRLTTSSYLLRFAIHHLLPRVVTSYHNSPRATSWVLPLQTTSCHFSQRLSTAHTSLPLLTTF